MTVRLSNTINRFLSTGSSWWIGLAVIVVLAAVPRLLSFRFSLPYVDHPDEPIFYLTAQDWRGLFDTNNYIKGYPPGYIVVNAIIQVILEALGQRGLAPTILVLRLLAVIVNLITLILIAETARLIAGDFAGWVAGAAWAVAPLVLMFGVLATPDPFVYLFVAMALWMATVALLDPRRGWWCILSVIAGLVAILFKYPVLTAIAPGGLVAIAILLKDRQRGIRYLAVQTGIVLITVIGLVAFYPVVAFLQDNPREVLVARNQGLQNLLEIGRLANNLYYAALPLNPYICVIVLVLGLVAFAIARWRGWERAKIGPIGLCVFLILTIPWLAGTFSLVTLDRLKDTLPATALLCVLIGVGAYQIAVGIGKLTTRIAPFRFALVALALVVTVAIPQTLAAADIVRDHQLADRRIALRQWADINLEPGTFLVDEENHKTFNPFWGGLTGQKQFDWWVTSNFMQYPVAIWRDERKMSYAAIPVAQWRAMQDSEAGRAFLAQMLHLRDFVSPPLERGPEVAVYRLWRMDMEVQVSFGNQITLVGFDRSTEQASRGDTLQLRFYWRANALPTTNYSVYVHLTPLTTREVLGQADGAPAALARPTLTWDDPGETLISAPFGLRIRPDLAAGQYRILIGLYDYMTGVRLQTSTGEDFYPLMNVIVK